MPNKHTDYDVSEIRVLDHPQAFITWIPTVDENMRELETFGGFQTEIHFN